MKNGIQSPILHLSSIPLAACCKNKKDKIGTKCVRGDSPEGQRTTLQNEVMLTRHAQ